MFKGCLGVLGGVIKSVRRCLGGILCQERLKLS